VKKAGGDALKVMPLEALWWVDDPHQQDIVAAVAPGRATMADTDRERWQWRGMAEVGGCFGLVGGQQWSQQAVVELV
jgi:hypothetical protein